MATIDFEVKGQTGHRNILTTHYLENSFLDRHQTLYTVHLKELITLMGFEVNGQSQNGPGHKEVLAAQYLDNPLLDGHQLLYTGTS
jgi:hypothetical protein